MAKTSPLEDLLGGLIDRLADRLASRLGGGLPRRSGAGASAAKVTGRKRRSSGRKLDMSCRVDGCKNRSRGPRFGFICDDHRKKLSKKDQQAARDAFKAKQAKAA